MPLPEKIIEKLAREPARTPGWSGRLLMFAGTLFLIAVFVYAGLKFGYTPYLRRQSEKLDDEIVRYSQQIPLSDQTKLVHFYSQLVNVKNLLDRHTIGSPTLEWLERNTHASVYFTKFSLSAVNQQVSLTGMARSLKDASEQIQIFQSQPEVQRVSIGNAAQVASGGWQFDVNLFFKPNFFRAAAQNTAATQ